MALSIGTFNIEYFNVSGKNAYSPSHCSSLAKTITASQVVKQQKVLASDSAESYAKSEAFPLSDDTIVYITKTGKKYHTSGCSSLRKSKIPITLAEAKAKGHTPCSKCHPPR